MVTDFGCCLADSNLGLRVPYHTDDMFKGGNGTLMAPEVSRSMAPDISRSGASLVSRSMSSDVLFQSDNI